GGAKIRLPFDGGLQGSFGTREVGLGKGEPAFEKFCSGSMRVFLKQLVNATGTGLIVAVGKVQLDQLVGYEGVSGSKFQGLFERSASFGGFILPPQGEAGKEW